MERDVLADREEDVADNLLLESLSGLLATHHGTYFLLWLLRELGFAMPVSTEPGRVAQQNLALNLVSLMAQAAPNQARNILWAMYGLEETGA